MKIALVSDWYAPRIGGLENQVRDLGLELAARGHEVQVFTSTPGEPDEGPVRVHRLARLPGLAVVRPLGVVDALARAFERVDLVHAHSALSPLSLLALRAARRLGLPSVLTEHSVLRGAGAAALGALDGATGWGGWPDLVTGVSRYVARELTAVTGRGDVEVLPNGVRPETWRRPEGLYDDGQLRVVSTMRLTARKRPMDLVRLIPKVVARLGRDVPLRFCLVGGGPEAQRVRREAVRLGVAHLLELPGWQPRSAVRAWLARSSVFVLPTSKEALSIASLEALCAGLPVVAYDHGGVGDIVVDGREGFLVRDEEAFVERLVALLGDAELRRRMGEAGRTHVERFAWPRVIDRHLACYRAASGRRSVPEAA